MSNQSDDVNNDLGRIIGLDVHPDTITAAGFLNSRSNTLEPSPLWIKERISTSKFSSWLEKTIQQGDLFVLEAGSNSFEIADQVKKAGGHAVVLESQRVGQIKKSYLKNDKIDAIKIARVYLSGLAHEVYIPDQITREYREIFFAHEKAKKLAVRSRNQLWAWLNAHGVKKPKNIELTKTSGEQWLLRIRDWSHTQKSLLKCMRERLLLAHNQRKELRSVIAREVVTNPDMLKLLRLYGVRHIIAFALIAFIGDISRFRNHKKLVAYIGLQPRVNYSGNGGTTGSIAHGGRKELRSLLVQAAHCILVRAPETNSLAQWGRKKRWTKKAGVVVIGVARKLTVAIWYLLRGFFTPLTEVDKTLTVKLQKLSTEIGKEGREELGYDTVTTFVLEKGKKMMAGT